MRRGYPYSCKLSHRRRVGKFGTGAVQGGVGHLEGRAGDQFNERPLGRGAKSYDAADCGGSMGEKEGAWASQ